MASTYSTRLKTELIGDGEQSNTWGTTTNNNFGNIFDESISNVYTKTLSGSGTTALTWNNLDKTGFKPLILLRTYRTTKTWMYTL